MLSGPCSTCPNNQYGSAAEGAGKACSNNLWMYVLLDGEVLPSVIKASPASKGKKGRLITWLTLAPNIAAKAGLGIKYQLIKVKFCLHKKSFSSGMNASVIDLTTVRPLDLSDPIDEAEYQKIASIWQGLKDSYFGRIKESVAGNLSEDTPPSNGIFSAEETGAEPESDYTAAAVPNPDRVGENPPPPDDGMKF